MGKDFIPAELAPKGDDLDDGVIVIAQSVFGKWNRVGYTGHTASGRIPVGRGARGVLGSGPGGIRGRNGRVCRGFKMYHVKLH